MPLHVRSASGGRAAAFASLTQTRRVGGKPQNEHILSPRSRPRDQAAPSPGGKRPSERQIAPGSQMPSRRAAMLTPSTIRSRRRKSCFRQAIEIARSQQSKSLELRASSSCSLMGLKRQTREARDFSRRSTDGSWRDLERPTSGMPRRCSKRSGASSFSPAGAYRRPTSRTDGHVGNAGSDHCFSRHNLPALSRTPRPNANATEDSRACALPASLQFRQQTSGRTGSTKTEDENFSRWNAPPSKPTETRSLAALRSSCCSSRALTETGASCPGQTSAFGISAVHVFTSSVSASAPSSASASAISGISGIGEKPSRTRARTAWASAGRPVDW